MVIGFDLVVLRDLALQIRALGFASVAGEITGASSAASPFPQRQTYDPVVRYRYTVDGRAFEGRLRHRLTTSSSSWAEGTARHFPRGTPVRVAYDPRNPARSVIEPGVRSSDLLALLFSVPFNFVTSVMWYAVFIAWRDRHGPPLAGAARIVRTGSVIRASIPHASPWLAAGAAAAAATFAILIVLVTLWPGPPGVTTAVCAWVLVTAAAGYFWRWRRVRRESGDEDLVIDHAADLVTLPLELGRTSSESVAISTVVKVTTEEIVTTKRDGTTIRSWQPSLLLRDRAEPLPISRWGSAELAHSFAAWLEFELARRPHAEDARRKS
jgi:hypothetical protein